MLIKKSHGLQNLCSSLQNTIKNWSIIMFVSIKKGFTSSHFDIQNTQK